MYKRISVLFCSLILVSSVACDYVGPGDSDDDSSSGWADGLSTKQMVEGMIVTANEVESNSRSTSEGIEVEVTWSVPLSVTGWVLSYRYTEDEDWNPIDADVSVEKGVSDWDKTATYKYGFSKFFSFKLKQYIVYIKIAMQDNNGEIYENVVSFMVSPYDRKLRVRIADEIEAEAPSALYFMNVFQTCPYHSPTNGNYTELFDNVKSNFGKSAKIELSALHMVQFAIATDLSDYGYDGINTVYHYSNTSYCKTEVCDAVDGAEATLKYSFEDLPVTLLSLEGTGYFDYDDVVFYVDIIE